MDEITILDKTYISSKRAAEITGYAKDYVGQLCREGHIDAKMVGRGWYVYEPSIRKHRFGTEEEVTVPKTVSEAFEVPVETPAPAWEPSVYKSEPLAMIPELQTPVVSPIAPESSSEGTVGSQEDAAATLTDMQSAWREWFDRKQEVPEESLEATQEAEEEPVEAFEANDEPVEEEFSVPIHKIAEPEEEVIQEVEQEEPDTIVHIQRISQPEPTPALGIIREERIIPRTAQKKGRKSKIRSRKPSNVPLIALFVAISLVSIVIAIVGTGHADTYLKTFVGNNAVVNFILGTKVLTR